MTGFSQLDDIGSSIVPADEICDPAEPAEHPTLQEARGWVHESHNDETNSPNIFLIVNGLIQDAKKMKTPQALRSIMSLTAITHFVKLRERYEKHPNCTQPTLKASLTAARRLGKGSYFARKIREHERYLLKYHHLLLTKK